jgi:hypothetical protein
MSFPCILKKTEDLQEKLTPILREQTKLTHETQCDKN